MWGVSSPANVQSDTRRLLVSARVGVAIGLLLLAGPVSAMPMPTPLAVSAIAPSAAGGGSIMPATATT
jgi:hypothetical protein